MLLCRGVFQNLIEKHFPAPDRRKTMDLISSRGSDSLFSDSRPQSPVSTLFGKRKATDNAGKSTSLAVCLTTMSSFYFWNITVNTCHRISKTLLQFVKKKWSNVVQHKLSQSMYDRLLTRVQPFMIGLKLKLQAKVC